MGPLAEAAVELVADGKQFGASARKTIRKSLAGADKDIGKSLNRDMSKYGERGGADWSQAFRTAIANNLVGKLGAVFAPLRGIGKAIGFSFLAVQMASAASAAVQLAAALAPAAGIVAALPAGIAVAGAAFGTLKLALAGVGDAFGAAMTGDAQKFQESLKGLSPAARTVATDLRSLKPAFDDLKNTVQDAFFQPLVGQIQQVGKALLGPLKTGMAGVAAEMGTATRGVAAFAREGATVDVVGQVFAATRKVIANIAPALRPILRGFRDLVAVALPGVTKLSASVGQLGTQFGAWMSQVAKSGQALAWIDGAVAVFRQLWTVVSGLGGLLAGVFRAANAAGGDMLGLFGQLIQSANEFVNSAKGQQALVTIFQSLNRVGSQMGPIFGALGAALAQIAPQAAAVAEAIGPGIASAISALGPAIAALGPGLTAVATGLSEAFAAPALATGLQSLATGFSSLLSTLAPLAPLVSTLAGFLGSALGTALQTISVALTPIVAGFRLLNDVLGGLQGPLGVLSGVLGGLAGGILAIVTAVKIWTAVQWALNAALNANPISLIVLAIAGLVGGLIWAYNNVGWFRDFWDAAWQGIQLQVQTAVAVIRTLWTGFLAWWAAIWQQIKGPVTATWTFITTFVTVTFQALRAFIQGIMQAVVAVFQGAWTAITAVFQGAITVIQGIWNVFAGVFTGNWTRVWQGLRQIAQGTWAAITGVVRGALMAIQGVIQAVLGTIQAIWTVMWNAVRGSVMAAWNGIVAAVTAGVNRVLGAVASLPGRIQGFFAGAGSWLLQAGRNIITGLINGIKSMIGAVGDAIGGIANKIKGFLPFSPAKEGPLSGRGAPLYSGRSIGRQLATGIRQQRGLVQGEMRRITTLPRTAGARHAGPFSPATRSAHPGRSTHRQVTVSAPITVHSHAANPAIVARRTADRLAALAQG